MPQQPTPKNKTLRTVLITVGAVLVLCCGAAGIGGWYAFKNVSEGIGPAQDAAAQFVTDLERGDTDAAYAQLCSDTQKSFSKADITDMVAKQPKVTGHTVSGTSISSMNGRTTATVVMSLQLDNGASEQHPFPMLKESGTWKVCGRPY